MILAILLAVSLALFVLAWLTRNRWPWGGNADVASPGGAQVAALRQQLEQLRSLNRSGALDEAQFAQARQDLERRIVDAVVNPPVSVNGPRRAAPRLATRLLTLAGVVSLVAAAASVLFDNAQVVAPDTDTAAAGASAPDNGHALTSGQIDAMLDNLATRLKENPADADGWAMLGRSYAVLGRHADALPALKKAVELRPKDATLLADYADALAVNNGQNLEGEPSLMIERALAVDPNHLKALSLAGTAAFNRKDYAGALRHWDKLVQLAPSSEAVQQIQGGIDEARKLAGSAAPAATAKSGAARPTLPASAAAKAPAGSSISGTVSLAPALLAKTRPDDTLFVFARAAEGPRMPLAILKRQVKDLPLAFTLDDSLAMSPAATLSTAQRVVVGARVSRSGNAVPQAGDLQGLSAPTAPHAIGLRIQITEVIAGP